MQEDFSDGVTAWHGDHYFYFHAHLFIIRMNHTGGVHTSAWNILFKQLSAERKDRLYIWFFLLVFKWNVASELFLNKFQIL